ncbi:MAG: SDR family oxidoreductase, partial [Amylibacter sp.]|nr:SDR family oxidoreductase [Amylibacter sp.]
ELPDAVKDGMLGAIPLGRMGAVDEIASAVAYLATDEASYITGETLHVNGGMVMI